ncbi:MAG TPA: hypothetical protein VGJ91_18315, partial [Polyangiaceae bacterium]
MNIESIRALSGSNLWSDQPVLEAVVVFDRAGLGPEVLPRLCGSLPSELGAAIRRDFVAADAAASWAGVLARLVVGLQATAGCQVSFWVARPLDKQGAEYRIAAEYAEEPTARRALSLALSLIHAARDAQPVELEPQLLALRRLNEDTRLGPSTGCIVRAAQERKIPVRRLTGSLVQFGQGARQRRIWAAETDRTSAVAEAIAQDKELTKSLLDAVGIPVP